MLKIYINFSLIVNPLCLLLQIVWWYRWSNICINLLCALLLFIYHHFSITIYPQWIHRGPGLLSYQNLSVEPSKEFVLVLLHTMMRCIWVTRGNQGTCLSKVITTIFRGGRRNIPRTSPRYTEKKVWVNVEALLLRLECSPSMSLNPRLIPGKRHFFST